MTDKTRAERIWDEIQQEVAKEAAEKRPGDMTVKDFVAALEKMGVSITLDAARSRLNRMAAKGRLIRRKAYVFSEGAICTIYTPVDETEQNWVEDE